MFKNHYSNRSAHRARATATFAAHKAVATLCAGAFAAPARPFAIGARVWCEDDAEFGTVEGYEHGTTNVYVTLPHNAFTNISCVRPIEELKAASTPLMLAATVPVKPIHSDTDMWCDVYDPRPAIVKAAAKLPSKAKVNSWGLPDQRIANDTRAMLAEATL